MASADQKQFISAYARLIRDARRADPGATEPGLAPLFAQLLRNLLPTLPAAPALTVLAEYVQGGVGRPDIALSRPAQPARAFIELKAYDKPTDGARWRTPHDRRQFARFSEFADWATCNFHEVRRYERGEDQGSAVLVPLAALDPARPDATAERLLAAHDPDPALRVLERLAQAQAPAATDAEELAVLLAHAARLVKATVKDRLAELTEEGATDAPLQQVRQEFREVLYSHPEAAGYANEDFDELFAGAFAQTLAFGLLLVREATGTHLDHRAADHMPPEHPLMRTALNVLSQDAIRAEVGAAFDVILDTVNSGLADPAILAVQADGRDPILHFYEDFLRTFDEPAWRRFGVVYTPVQVVRFMVSALDRALRERLGTRGLADPGVHILDPATGTGTFLLGLAERVRADLLGPHGAGPGQAPPALQGLVRRMYGFELLVGPYAVAHFRLHHTLSRPVEEGGVPISLPRLGVYLADTLARPQQAERTSGLAFFGRGIADEANAAEEVRSRQEILAIIGNPPYRRLKEGEDETLVGRWMNDLWADLKRTVSEAGWGDQLNTFPELSVAFWRWSMWKLFEADGAPRRGVVAFITNRKFLTGKPYAGLRKMMRERFDHIEVVDLRGDSRAARRAGFEGDQNVFDIQVGVAITVCVADGQKEAGAPASVGYVDAWANEHISRRGKLAWLSAAAETGALPDTIVVERDWLDNFRPKPFENGEWLSLAECFSFSLSGVQTKRDDFIYAPRREQLSERIRRFIGGRSLPGDPSFAPTNARTEPKARARPFEAASLLQASYRPLDRRWLYREDAYIDRPRPDLRDAWGNQNAGLYTLPGGVGEGPAVWCHGLLPDYHAFRGSYGGYAFPLYDNRPGHGPFNITPDLLAALGEAYGAPASAADVFDAVLALLSATSYTTRFGEDLEDVFPHVPFPADPAVFAEAARLGAAIRAVETFARPPADAYRGLARAVTAPTGPLQAREWRDGEIALCADGSGRIIDIPLPVWEFAVSGYRLLFRWLDGRRGLPVDAELIPELRDVVQRIAELLDLFAAADEILARALADVLSRPGLILPADAEGEPAV